MSMGGWLVWIDDVKQTNDACNIPSIVRMM